MAPILALLALALPSAVSPPAVGDKAPAFDLKSLEGKRVRLAPMLKKGPVVLVVLRGWPGYQCPFCTRQVGELISKSPEFAKSKAQVVMVYPGPAEGLQGHAAEFISGKDVPKGYHFTFDPDYAFTNQYGLRWDAPRETAYPSTFVIGKDGKVRYAKISHEHGDRPPVADVLAALPGKPFPG